MGESHYQPALARVGKPTPEGLLNRWVTAQLVPEPSNPYDSDAIRVELDGRHVGYLPAGETHRFGLTIEHLHQSGYPATCRARLNGGSADKPFIGITLLVDYDVAPLTDRSCFLPGDERDRVGLAVGSIDQDLAELLRAGLERTTILCSLDLDDGGQIRATATDGRTIGLLTPTMSARFGPMILEVLGAGLPTAVRATLKLDERGRTGCRICIARWD